MRITDIIKKLLGHNYNNVDATKLYGELIMILSKYGKVKQDEYISKFAEEFIRNDDLSVDDIKNMFDNWMEIEIEHERNNSNSQGNDYTDYPDDYAIGFINDNNLSDAVKSFNQEPRNYSLQKTQKKGRTHHLKEAIRNFIKNCIKKVKVIIAGVLIGVILVGGSLSFNLGNYIAEKNHQNNVCIEYVIQKGDTSKKLDSFMMDWGVVDPIKTGVDRDYEIYYGESTVGRTTPKVAEELQQLGLATFISLDKALELLGNNNSLRGEFKKAAEGESQVAFFVPTVKRTL